MEDLESLLDNKTAFGLYLKKSEEAHASLQVNTDAAWIILNAIIVYFIQAGFGFLECGSVRAKNATNILLKNLLDSFIGAFAYWWIGWAFAYGDKANSFCGYSQFGLHGLDDSNLAVWFFQYTFAATTATIVSGAVAERCTLIAYFTYSFFLSGFVYPVVSHWVWTEVGWLSAGYTYTDGDQEIVVPYQDFAGSGAVHALGGVAAFVAALFLGPRIGRFDDDGKPKEIPGHSVPLVSLGAFILVMGFFSFNAGSGLSISQPGDGVMVSLIVTNTIISGSAGGVTCILYKAISAKVRNEKVDWSLEMCILGGLGGLVSVCGGVNVVRPWAAFVIGVVGGLIMLLTKWAVLAVKVDDPLSATAVHAGPGLWGALAAPIFDSVDKGVIYEWNRRSGMRLGWNVVGLLAIIAWTVGTSVLLFGGLRLLKLLRVSEQDELKGLDYIKHGEVAYPNKAYGDGWHNKRFSMDLRTTRHDIDSTIAEEAEEVPQRNGRHSVGLNELPPTRRSQVMNSY